MLSPIGIVADPRPFLQALQRRGWEILQLSPGLCGYGVVAEYLGRRIDMRFPADSQHYGDQR